MKHYLLLLLIVALIGCVDGATSSCEENFNKAAEIAKSNAALGFEAVRQRDSLIQENIQLYKLLDDYKAVLKNCADEFHNTVTQLEHMNKLLK